MKTFANTLCLAVPENIRPELVSTVKSWLMKQNEFSHYEIHVFALPHDPKVVFNQETTRAFVEEARQYGIFAFLTFSDGGIHFAHGKVLHDRWSQNHSRRVIEVNPNGNMTSQDPLQLFDKILSAGQTIDHIWDPSHHYMLPLLH